MAPVVPSRQMPASRLHVYRSPFGGTLLWHAGVCGCEKKQRTTIFNEWQMSISSSNIRFDGSDWCKTTAQVNRGFRLVKKDGEHGPEAVPKNV